MIVPNLDDVKLRAMLLGAYGHDDLGAAQTKTGTITAIANASGYAKYSITDHGLIVKEPFNVTGTSNHNGPQKVVQVVDEDTIISSQAFVEDDTGAFDKMGGAGSWIGFVPIGADLVADNDIANLIMADNAIVTGDPKLLPYINGLFYPFGTIITKILMAANNVRLIRWAEDLS